MSTLRDLRKDRSLDEVSTATGIDTSTLSRVERGAQFPSRPTMKSLASYYGISEGEVYVLASNAVDANKEKNQAA